MGLLNPEDFVARFARVGRLWQDVSRRGFHLRTIPERKVQLPELFFSLYEAISKFLIIAATPYRGKRIPEDAAETDLLDPAFSLTKDPLKR